MKTEMKLPELIDYLYENYWSDEIEFYAIHYINKKVKNKTKLKTIIKPFYDYNNDCEYYYDGKSLNQFLNQVLISDEKNYYNGYNYYSISEIKVKSNFNDLLDTLINFN